MRFSWATCNKTLSSQMWLARQAKDVYVKKRDEQGWASRSAFKLIEMDEKHKLLRKGLRVLDLGAAPGGWTQVALRKGCVVTSLDLLAHAIPPSEPCLRLLNWIVGDFLDPNVQARISGSRYHLIMCDMAPNYGGIEDHTRLIGLAEMVVEFAKKNIVTGGRMVIKISRGGEENEVGGNFVSTFLFHSSHCVA
jgi:23S rRNA (uridine2552-2'-O)-methyltransferase